MNIFFAIVNNANCNMTVGDSSCLDYEKPDISKDIDTKAILYSNQSLSNPQLHLNKMLKK